MPRKRIIINIPNILTMFRILLIPIFVLVFFLPFEWARLACAVLFATAAATDWLDGYLARRLGQTSAFGTFLDPVADKLMVSIALVLLVQGDPRLLIVIPAVIIIGREIAISGLREWMAEIGERKYVAVSKYGKFKTGSQMLAIILMLYQGEIMSLSAYSLGLILLYVAATLTLISMLSYLNAAWPSLTADGESTPEDEQKQDNIRPDS